MKFWTTVYGLALIDGAVLRTIGMITIEYSGDDGLRNDTPTLVVNQSGIEHM